MADSPTTSQLCSGEPWPANYSNCFIGSLHGTLCSMSLRPCLLLSLICHIPSFSRGHLVKLGVLDRTSQGVSLTDFGGRQVKQAAAVAVDPPDPAEHDFNEENRMDASILPCEACCGLRVHGMV